MNIAYPIDFNETSTYPLEFNKAVVHPTDFNKTILSLYIANIYQTDEYDLQQTINLQHGINLDSEVDLESDGNTFFDYLLGVSTEVIEG